MKLYDILEGNAETLLENIEIKGITDNTANVTEGGIFVCVKGGSFDGHTAAEEMLSKGAACVVCERDLGLGERQIITDNSRRLYGLMCSAWFGHPERRMKLIGVTGTNGKTTITSVIKKVLTANGCKVGLVGTIQNEIGDEVIHTGNTTPMVYELMELFDRMYRSGCTHVVMEVSSFGLVQYRIGASYFDAAVFTNLTQDHLDYHKTMEEYYKAKRMLFDICRCAVINTDDDYGKRLFDEISCEKYSYGINDKADFRADDIKMTSSGTSFKLTAEKSAYQINTKMTGGFNVVNLTAVMAACMKTGFLPEQILPVIEACSGVKGRCEVIPTDRDFTVICDYAHTPDAVENILRSVKEYTEGRLICLFGCGGNRDAAKRPKMAAAAAKYSDMLIVTSDNPRDEEPDAIIDEIITGLEGETVPYDRVTDRREAIFHALSIARSGDIIVLAGKGHEDYQILSGGRHIHFDEREIVAEKLKLL